MPEKDRKTSQRLKILAKRHRIFELLLEVEILAKQLGAIETAHIATQEAIAIGATLDIPVNELDVMRNYLLNRLRAAGSLI
jgi:hypothetical protein